MASHALRIYYYIPSVFFFGMDPKTIYRVSDIPAEGDLSNDDSDDECLPPTSQKRQNNEIIESDDSDGDDSFGRNYRETAINRKSDSSELSSSESDIEKPTSSKYAKRKSVKQKFTGKFKKTKVRLEWKESKLPNYVEEDCLFLGTLNNVNKLANVTNKNYYSS